MQFVAPGITVFTYSLQQSVSLKGPWVAPNRCSPLVERRPLRHLGGAAAAEGGLRGWPGWKAPPRGSAPAPAAARTPRPGQDYGGYPPPLAAGSGASPARRPLAGERPLAGNGRPRAALPRERRAAAPLPWERESRRPRAARPGLVVRARRPPAG